MCLDVLSLSGGPVASSSGRSEFEIKEAMMPVVVVTSCGASHGD